MTAPRHSPAVKDSLALADQLRPALHRLYRKLRREGGNVDTPLLQNLLLAVILEHPGIGVGDLARMENLRGPTISARINRMATAGLVARTAGDPEDRRRVGLVVTEKGRTAIEALRRRRRDWLALQLTKLSPTARQAIRNAIAPLSEIGR
jgi:DNA-binding MarR family transcriptional regulator